jgi:uncharacterized membrane protein
MNFLLERDKNNRFNLIGGMTFAVLLAVLLFGFADQSLLSPLINPLLIYFFKKYR